MSNRNDLGYEEITAMNGCGIDDTDRLFREKRFRDHGPALELVSDCSDFFGDFKHRPYQK